MYPHHLLLVGSSASEAAFKEHAGEHSVLHLAAHAVASDGAPMYTAIVLGPSGEEDGFLEAREIADLRLKAEIAVLSACDTARSDDFAREGMIGLSWAFLVAGCPVTVASQWKAESEATKRMMVDFHRALRAGATPARALRAAQIRLSQEPRYADPLYWAPFIVIGAN